MSEDIALPTTHTRIDRWTQAWRFASSPRILAGMMFALAVLALISALIPQVPAEIASDPSATARWVAMRAQAQGWPGQAIASLGLHRIYNSPLWWLLCGLLFIALAVQLADMLPDHWQRWRREPDPDAAEAPESQVNVPLADLVQRLQEELSAAFDTIYVQAGEKQAKLVAQSQRLGLWAIPLVLAGGLLLLTGLWISRQAAWHESNIFLPPGRSVRLAHRPEVSLQLTDTQPPQIEINQADQTAHLTLTDARSQRWHGIRFYLVNQTPAVTIEARAADGQALSLQPLTEGEPTDRLTLSFPRPQAESGFAVASQNIVFRLVSFAHLPTDPSSGPALLVQAFQGSAAEPIYSQFITEDTTITIQGVRYLLQFGRSVTLAASHDPGALLVLSGAFIVSLGYLLLLLYPYRGCAIALQATRGGTRARWVFIGPSGVHVQPSLLAESSPSPGTRSVLSARWAAIAPALAAWAWTASLAWGQWVQGRYWTGAIWQKLLLAVTLATIAWHLWRSWGIQASPAPRPADMEQATTSAST